MLQDMSEGYDGYEGFPIHTQESAGRQHSEATANWSALGKDKLNVIILIFLYVLQGEFYSIAGKFRSVVFFLSCRIVSLCVQRTPRMVLLGVYRTSVDRY